MTSDCRVRERLRLYSRWKHLVAWKAKETERCFRPSTDWEGFASTTVHPSIIAVVILTLPQFSKLLNSSQPTPTPLCCCRISFCKLYTMQSLLTRGSSLAARRLATRTGATRGFAKEIKFGTEGRAAMLRGVEVLADAVQVRTESGFLKFPVFCVVQFPV